MLPLAALLLLPAILTLPVEVKKPEELVTYTDDFARNIMMPLSAAAYSSQPQKCVSRVLDGTVKRQITVNCDGFNGDTCSGFTAVSNSKKAIIISFRGTNGFLQLIQEGGTTLFSKLEHFINGGNVNHYFNQAFLGVWAKGMKDDFLTLKQTYPGYELWVTGHSLGGSMASLAASYIASAGLFDAAKIKLVTFGQPRTGDATFAAKHDAQFSFSYRVTHAHDMVPHVPIEWMGFTHHLAEVFYQAEDMGKGAKYTVCSSQEEDKDCSDGNYTDISIDDHLHYFDQKLSDYGDAGCQ